MDEDLKKLILNHLEIIKENCLIIESVMRFDDDPPIEVSVRVDKLTANSICLFCETKIRKNDKTDRGCHSRCAQKIRRNIRSGKTNERLEVKAGRWLPGKSGGRPVENDPFEDTAREIAGLETTAQIKRASMIDTSEADQLMEDHERQMAAESKANYKQDQSKKKPKSNRKKKSG